LNLGASGRRALRSPMAWIALLVALIGLAATVAVGVELYRSTAAPMVFDRR
jgi:hypothetical protein